MSLIGYARVCTNLEGKIYKVEDLKGITVQDDCFIGDYLDIILNSGDLLQEKDCDLLVTVNITTVDSGNWEYTEYEDVISFPNVMVLQNNMKDKLSERILELDHFITEWSLCGRSFNTSDGFMTTKSTCFEGMLYENIEEAKEALYEMHDEYLSAYNEDVPIIS